MTFNVVFKGVLPGVDLSNAKQSFAGLFNLDSEKVEKIFSAKSVVIKSNISEEIAQKLVDKLTSIGVDAQMIAVSMELNSPQASVSSSSESMVKPFIFSGNGGEYFKIWIVNVLLSIVTLGIYSAWAKVRNKQYFYGNTTLDGSSFEYTANPVKILIGRLIAIGFYIVFLVSSSVSPIVSIVMGLLLFVLIPFIIVSSLRFNARHSVYRNVGFRFHGGIGRALIVFVGWPILGLLTLTLLLPFAWKRQMDYLVNNHAYGTERFSINTQVSQFYSIYFILIGASIAFAIVFFLAMFLVGGSAALIGAAGSAGLGAGLGIVGVLLIFVLYIGFLVFVHSFMAVSMANIKYQHTHLKEHKFQSNWEIVSYAGVYFVNTLLTILTLGFYIPYAKVRMAAYMAEHTQFVAAGDLNQFAAAEKEQVNSVAEGVHDIFDIDISI